MMSKRIRCGFIKILVTLVFCVGNASTLVNAQSQSRAVAIGLDEIDWGPEGGGDGFPVGVRTSQQGVDPVTGGITYYALFPAGSTFDLHWHTHDEFVVVAQGRLQIQLGEKVFQLQTGSYVVIPGSLSHKWTVPEDGQDAIILVRRAGPADFHFVASP